ncbi:MAG: hypothetical protein JW747_06440 [Candidatus Aminicenantes bacterium]|nr:hypothetical protein [Candidatus Aminicenantes bacterium]
MMRTNVVLVGFGNVGRAFVRLSAEKQARLAERHGIGLRLKAVFRSGGGILAEDREVDLGREVLDRGVPKDDPRFRPGLRPEAAFDRLKPGVLVECLSAHPETGEPALGYLRAAIARGWHAVTASKGPLAADANGLRRAARSREVGFRFSAAAGAALPAADVGIRCLAGAEVVSFQGILNGTTNFLLTRMAAGQDYGSALADAQKLGIAEPDPERDISGWDSAVKLLILSNLLFDESLKLKDVKVKGLTAAPASDVRRAAAAGRKVKLLAVADRGSGRTSLRVAPEPLDARHPLFPVDGAEKGVSFLTDSMGTVTVLGGKSDPRAAAAAMLKDIILLLKDRDL